MIHNPEVNKDLISRGVKFLQDTEGNEIIPFSSLNQDDVVLIPAFGTSTEGNEILYIKPYKPGYFYYSPVAYQGGVQYAELEEEISNFHLNNVLNGLAPGMLINFNNGVPDEDMQQVIEDDIRRKYQGSSNAGRFILAFNDSKESSATIDAVQLSDAHNLIS